MLIINNNQYYIKIILYTIYNFTLLIYSNIIYIYINYFYTLNAFTVLY